MVKRTFLDQPMHEIKELWEVELVGRQTENYKPRQAAEQLYSFIHSDLPYDTERELFKIIREKHSK